MEPGPDFTRETALIARGLARVAGVDEVGRGPLAGPVVAAAVILDPGCIPDGLNDSKKLTARARAALHDALFGCACIGIGQASVAEIDEINILRAAHLAMRRAIAALGPAPDHCLIDGHMLPLEMTCAAEPLIRGDGLCASIAAASIVAKVTRDRIMVDLAQQHPRLWLGDQHGLWRARSSRGAEMPRCDPTSSAFVQAGAQHIVSRQFHNRLIQ